MGLNPAGEQIWRKPKVTRIWVEDSSDDSEPEIELSAETRALCAVWLRPEEPRATVIEAFDVDLGPENLKGWAEAAAHFIESPPVIQRLELPDELRLRRKNWPIGTL